MKLGVQVGLGPGHIVLDGDPPPPSPKGHSPPMFGLYLLRPNGCMDQVVTWYGARPQPRRLCVRWRPHCPVSQKGADPPKKSAHVHCGQTAGWLKLVLGMEVGLRPGDFVLNGDAAPFPKKETRARGRSPQFVAHVYCSQTAGWIKLALGMEVSLGRVHIVLDGDTAPLPKKEAEPPSPIFGPSLL